MADRSNNHEIIRMLLSAPNPLPKGQTDSPTSMENQRTYEDDYQSGLRFYDYLEQLSEKPEEVNVVEMDHSYSLPWFAKPETTYAKPARLLFFPRAPKVIWASERLEPRETPRQPRPAYDLTKARRLMEATSQIASLLREDPGDPEWELKIDKSGWTTSQSKLVDWTVRLLQAEELARLGLTGHWNEPVQRRISLDKTTRRFRTILSGISWNSKLTTWLHNLLLENLDRTYLIIYLDILQTLHSKVPALSERLLNAPVGAGINGEALKLLTKKPWDPASTGLNNYRPRRLPGNPLLVIVPYGVQGGAENTPRLQRWLPYLAALGRPVPVLTNGSSKITVVASLEQMLSASRAKLAELRSDYGGRPIVLVGLNSGSALALQVALVEPVTAVVCLGFPLNTVEGRRGSPEDSLLSLSTPTLFVIGQHAASSYLDDLEELREKLKVHSGLTVVGAGDDYLRIPKAKQKAEGLTQTFLDRCIIEEVSDFLGNLLSAPRGLPPPPPSSAKVGQHLLQGSTASSTAGAASAAVLLSSAAESPKFKMAAERKRRISGQEEPPPKRPYNTANRQRGGSGGGGGVTTRGGRTRGGRYRFTSTGDGGGGLGGRRSSERGTGGGGTVVRPAIDNISVMNPTNMDLVETGELQQPETALIGIDQLTADSLLEMPVIIAPPPPPQESAHHQEQQSTLRKSQSLKGVY